MPESPEIQARQTAHAAERTAHIENRAAGARNANLAGLVAGLSGRDFSVSTSLITRAIESLATAKPDDVQEIAASQIVILDSYYRTALDQAEKSFRSAQVLSGIGVFFFFSAAIILLMQQSRDLALVAIIGGATVEVVAGLVFWLYGRAATQLVHFYERLEQSQRFLLANTFCEKLDNDTKQRSRADLIAAMTSGITNATTSK
jgi:hypothetical protein